ncbi:MAG TPA: LacI family DNA-binding transcriptional regulator [Rhizomicrobium sp.]|nr:LacI family DNA-binding transcriptional regulator [Rhizomicrobium sp.]
MKDIARELGVSVVTVSKALRNHDDISEETRGKVLRLMRDLNYRPNLAARALVTGRSFIVGFVVPGLLHSFFAEIAKGLTNVFRKHGYGLVIATSEEDPELESQEIEQLLARRVDALIVASTQTSPATFARIDEQGIPYVLIDRRVEQVSANFVGVDDRFVGLVATEHLIQCGCRRIAYIYGSRLSPALGRLDGYRRALEKHRLPVRPEYIRALDETGDASDDATYAAMKELLALDEPPDGVFCFNDPGALNAMKAVLEAGLRIPEDVAVVGCGNIRHADFLRVPLTSIDQNSVAIGERAGKLALGLIESKTPQTPKTILLEPRLVVRHSSMRATAP